MNESSTAPGHAPQVKAHRIEEIVAGVLEPSAGSVQVNGRVAALLELGSGFNPELTGRENVKVNAAILGLTPAQIRERMDAIVTFADIGDYIDEPVKTYSSGMALRLAFAVQVHTDPDILIVDEALAVGDAAFQAKAMARIDEILSRGTTLLFVGHDLNAVKAFCRENLTGYKQPRYVEFRSELPKSNVGKILRKELREPSQA